MNPLTLGLAISTPGLREEVQLQLQPLPVQVVMDHATAIDDAGAFVEQVDRLRPDVLLLEVKRPNLELAELIPSLKETAATPMVVMVSANPDPEAILTAIRAGANEYVYSPLGSTLREALDRVSTQKAAHAKGVERRARTIAFLSVKGGCGATTLACHAAVDLARMTGLKVLLADFDFCAGAIRILMHVKSRYSVLDALDNTQRLDASYWHALVSNGYQGVEIIAGPGAELMKEHPRGHEIRRVVRFAKSQYDGVVIDLGAGLDPDRLRAIEEVDDLVLVTTAETAALQMSKLWIQHLMANGFQRERIRLVLNRMNRRVDLTAEEIESAIGFQIYTIVPNDYTALDQAYSTGHLLPENHHLRESIRRLVRKMMDIDTAEPRKRFSLFGL